MHGRTLLAVVALGLAVAAPVRAADDAGEAPVGLVWSAEDAARTPPLIAPVDAPPAAQRVVYGIAGLGVNARVAVRTLEKPGSEIGPGTTLGIDDIGSDATAFGQDGGVGLVAGPGAWAFAVHNDNGRVEIARVDVAGATTDAARGEEEYVLPGSAGCRVEATPLVAAGALWISTTGAGCSAVWRVPFDAGGQLGAAARTALAGLDALSSPAAVVLGDRLHVSVPAGAALQHFRAEGEGVPPAPPSASTQLPDGDLPRAPAAAGEVIAVAALTATGRTRVHRLRPSDGAVTATGPEFGGGPGPALAVAATGIVATTSDGVYVVDAATLQARPSDAGDPHSRTAAAVSGALGYLVSEAGDTTVVRLPEGGALAPADFDRVDVGAAFGAPALARGFSVLAGSSGVAVHRSRDVAPPTVELLEAAGSRLAARAADARGVARVEFRLARPGGVARVVGVAEAPEGGDPFGAGGSFAVEIEPPARGTYLVDAVAVDHAGNRAVSGRLVLRSGSPAGRPGACSNRLGGGARGDVLRGGRSGDRLLGRGGRDRLLGGRGADCLSGGKGPDRLSGGAGRDRLRGGPGRDVMRCGAGRDRVVADARDRVASDCERVRRR